MCTCIISLACHYCSHIINRAIYLHTFRWRLTSFICEHSWCNLKRNNDAGCGELTRGWRRYLYEKTVSLCRLRRSTSSKGDEPKCTMRWHPDRQCRGNGRRDMAEVLAQLGLYLTGSDDVLPVLYPQSAPLPLSSIPIMSKC